MQKQSHGTFFSHNYSKEVSQRPYIQDESIQKVVDLSKTKISSSFSQEIAVSQQISSNSTLNIKTFSSLTKEGLENEGIEKLMQKRRELRNNLQIKLMEEAKAILSEIQIIQHELRIENDTPITLEPNLSPDLLKQKIPLLKIKLDELRKIYKGKIIDDILLLDEELASSNDERSGQSFGK